MELFLDTSDLNALRFALYNPESGDLKEKFQKVSYEDSRKTINYLGKFLGKQKNNISKVVVVSGPGSFTGIRIGLSIGLGYNTALGVPVYAIQKNKVPDEIKELFVSKKVRLQKVNSNFDPDYGAEPNITISKKNAK